MEKMYYNWREIDGYGCPLKIVLSRRGLGKTFGAVKDKGIWKFMKHGKMFVYVVETKDMVKELCQNKGQKFFCNIIEFCDQNPSSKNNEMYKALIGSEVSEFEFQKTKSKDSTPAMTVGGAIKIQNKTAGYIVAYNDYGDLKRNNFLNPGTIIFDEFIPEERDIRNLRDPYKMVSVVESVARLKDVEIVMLGNSVRADDPVLIKLGLTNMKLGEFRRIYIDGELFGVCHYVDPEEYKKFDEVKQKTTAYKFAKLMGENTLNENTFKGAITDDLLLPNKLEPNHLLLCLHGADGISVRINATQSFNSYYVLTDYGRNTKLRYCVDRKYMTPFVRYSSIWYETLNELFQANKLKFENNMVYFYFKTIMKIK